jgi:hypothetical protein
MTDSGDVLAQVIKAIFTKFTATTGGSNNSFWTAINGRLFEDEPPEGCPFPYAVYGIIYAPKNWNFKSVLTRIMIQLSIYSDKMDSSEIKDIYYKASLLFNDPALSVTGSDFIMMYETNMNSIIEEHTTPTGTQRVRAYHVEFEVTSELK